MGKGIFRNYSQKMLPKTLPRKSKLENNFPFEMILHRKSSKISSQNYFRESLALKTFPQFCFKYFQGSFSSHNFSGEMFPRNAPKIFSREIYIESKVSLSNYSRKNYLPEALPRTTLDRTISWESLIQKTLPQFCFQIFSGKFLFLFSSRERFLVTMFPKWNPLRNLIKNLFGFIFPARSYWMSLSRP